MGAEYINGADNPIYKIADKLGVIADIISDTAQLQNAEYLIGNQPISRQDIDLFTKFVEPLDPKYRQLAKQHDLLSRVYTIKSIFMEDYTLFLKLSPRVLTEWNDKGTEGESFHTNKIGYKAILEHLRTAIPEHMFYFNTTILNINHSAAGVTLTTSKGIVSKMYDYVIVTSSLGHLKKYHHNLFTPPLPRQKIEAIEKIGFGGSCKMFFRWEKPWWSNETCPMIPLPVEGMARDVIDPFERELTTLQVLDWEPNTLTTWIAGAGQRVMDDMSDEEIIARTTKLIRDLKNDPSIEPPSEIIRTRLTKNELLLGSYSYMSQAQARARISHSRLAIPVKYNKHPRVLFAGEATHHRLFQTAIGAYLSGRREADRLNSDWESTMSSVFGRTGFQNYEENYTLSVNKVLHRQSIDVICSQAKRPSTGGAGYP
ncbi:amine oxidase [Teladorsagia circumcincta]|uniref:Amine oxidase n=1 Tax=Teladorsagia circumcincta TaxID=45464 RepID=A0A2G9UZL4_TELCI|nr:amine oxidase [Teladorsagia circumcincta]